MTMSMHSGALSRRAFLTAAATVGLGATSACGLRGGDSGYFGPQRSFDGVITIASADFSESDIIAEVWSRALRRRGIATDRLYRIGARDVYLAAVEEGSADLVPEYTGSLLSYLTHGEGETTADGVDEQLAALRTVAPEGTELLAPASAENRQSYVILRSVAEERRLHTLADLAGIGAFTLVGSPELRQRPDGTEGLTRLYGVPADAIEFLSISDSGGPLTLHALETGRGLVASVYTTTPLLVDGGRTTLDAVELADPKHLQAHEFVVPLARSEALRATGAQTVLDEITAHLTTEALRGFNLRYQGTEKASAELIAEDWLDNIGFEDQS